MGGLKSGDTRRRLLLIVIGVALAAAKAPGVSAAADPTPTPDPLCSHEILLSPASGQPGTIVDLRGRCYWVHSGRVADVFVDALRVGGIGGETGGDYHTLIEIPPASEPGRHLVRLVIPGAAEIGSAVFTVSRPPGPCTGDCNGDGRVALEELLAGIAIVLGQPPALACPDFGSADGGPLSVGDLATAVRNALRGCDAPPALESFAGAYEVAFGELSFIEFAGGVWESAGSVSADGNALSLEIDSFPGTIRVGAGSEPDGSLGLDGSFDVEDVGSSPATGWAIAQRIAGVRWITGEVSFQRFGSSRPDVLRFSMRQGKNDRGTFLKR